MKCKFYFVIFVILWIIISCKKEEFENQPSWFPTEYKSMISDSTVDDMNGQIKLYRINDNSCIMVGYNLRQQKECFFKLTYNNNKLSLENMPSLPYGNPRTIKDISFTDSNNGYVLINNFVQDEFISKLFYTNNGGVSWQERKININNKFTSIHFFHPDSGIAIYDINDTYSYDIYSTVDGGNNFQKIVDSYPTGVYKNSSFYSIPNNPKTCFINFRGSLYYSTNGGFNWNLHTKHGFDIRGMSFLNEKSGIVSVSTDLYSVNEIGDPFIKVFSHNMLAADNLTAVSKSVAYFIMYGIVFKTDNAFKTYHQDEQTDPFPFQSGDRFILDIIINPTFGILVDRKGTIYLKTKNVT